MRDWDDEFAVSAYIPGSEVLPAEWTRRAAAYRASGVRIDADVPYGEGARERMEVIHPDGPSQGLVVLVHGGFWMRTDRTDWTDLAEGARANGWTVVMPGYTQAPEARISQITARIAQAVTRAAALVPGPIRLVGHSAGGHLALRMICDDSPLAPEVLERIQRTVSIGGLHDLRPLRLARMNATLRLTGEEAAAESPALHLPQPGALVTFWTGGDERPEFLRQTRLMAEIWAGEAQVDMVIEPGLHHFSVLDGLKDPSSALVRALLDQKGEVEI